MISKKTVSRHAKTVSVAAVIIGITYIGKIVVDNTLLTSEHYGLAVIGYGLYFLLYVVINEDSEDSEGEENGT